MKQLKSLSGLWDVLPEYLTALYFVFPGLTSLNLSFAAVEMPDLVKLITRCSKLQKLWVMDLIEDKGLKTVALSCKELRETVAALVTIARNRPNFKCFHLVVMEPFAPD